MAQVTLHHGDLPDNFEAPSVLALDCETMGLVPQRDRLCLIQLSTGDGAAHVVQFIGRRYQAPNLKRIIADPSVLKLFHFARFDVAVIQAYLGVTSAPIYCTKIASRLTRTYAERHGLRDLCRELLDIELSKQQQSSDWGAETLSEEQLRYAANDVIYLHALKHRFDEMLARESRTAFAAACFAFLPTRAMLDLAGWSDIDIFAH